MEEKKKMVDVALALGGEGSEGFAHLGVVRALERGDFKDE
jgi:predicted acylesterase/phospholipase RssA